MELIKLSENKTIKSNELVEIINQFRQVEGKPELRHDNFLSKIENEIKTLRNNGISLLNFKESNYTNQRGKEYFCYELDHDGMLQMLNSESALVRYKTIEYINKLEAEIKSYSTGYKGNIEKAKDEMLLMGVTADILRLNDNSKLMLATEIYKNNNIPTNYLPSYTKSKGILKSPTELLKQFNINISTQKFNKILIEHGILKECTRPSTKDKNKTKKFKNLIDAYFGENQTLPKNPKETQPLYYEDKFEELLKRVNIL